MAVGRACAPRAQMPAKNANVTALPSMALTVPKYMVTMKERPQLVSVAAEAAVARMWLGKISPIIIQGIAPSLGGERLRSQPPPCYFPAGRAPSPSEKATMYAMSATSASQVGSFPL